MGLKTTIKNAIETGFAALGVSTSDGLQVSTDFYRVTGLGAYNPATGTKTPTEVLSTFEAIFYKVRSREVDGTKILIDDKRLIFPQSRIAFTPTTDDRVELGSDKYNIVNVIEDPATATWLLYLRGA